MKLGTLLQAGMLGAWFVCFFLVARTAALAPTAPEVRGGVRGLRRDRAFSQGNGFSQLEPAIRWLGARVSLVLPRDTRESLDRQLRLAGEYLGLRAEELVALALLSGVAGGVAGALADVICKVGVLLPVMTTVFGFAAPFLNVSSAATERVKAITRRLPNAVDLLALSMGAGLDFPGAVRQTIDRSGTPDDPLLEEFSLILRSLQLGRSRRQALEEFVERAPIDAVKEFVGAVVQAELRGNPLADVLRIQAEVSRQRRTVRAEEAAAKAGIKMIGPLILVFAAILILVLGPILLKLRENGL